VGAPAAVPVVRAAFGADNRVKLINEFLAATPAAPPWQLTYRLILWINRTTGLAHCYESDKCQPGKNWHGRSLRFHDWLAGQLGTTPSSLGQELDWLFRKVVVDYAHWVAHNYQRKLARAAAQRAPYVGRGFPEPGDDPGIVQIVREVLGDNLASEPTPEQWRTLTSRILELVALENKRKNIVGEGFEDVLTAVLKRADVNSRIRADARPLLQEVPGFSNVRSNQKPTRVDLAIVRLADRRRIMVTAKWSTRADREEQFKADWQKYVDAESDGETWDYVLVTNEFDPARLKRACSISAGHSRMLTHVVHISPDALRAVYGVSPEPTMQEVLALLDQGRIVGLDQWVAGLVA
jgi:hypothetical protein